MANLCRVVRTVSGLSRFVAKNERFSSTYNCGFVRKIESTSLDSIKFRNTTDTLSRTIGRRSNKILDQLPVVTLIQQRSMSSGDHARLWQVERLFSAAFIALLPGMVILQNPIVDGLFALLVVMHAHWGLEAVVVDYARPSVVGPILPKVAHLALYIFSAVTLVGLLALIYNGPGIGKTVHNFWAIGGAPPAHRS